MRVMPASETRINETEPKLSQMHPSARDPKFTERSESWIARWPESRDEAYRWIRTWSGRLRRAQAKAWKAQDPVSPAGGR